MTPMPTLLEIGAHLFLPATCAACHADLPLVSPRPPLCRACRSHLRLEPETTENDGYLNSFFAAGPFEGRLRDLLLAFKYEGKDYLTGLVVDLWTENWNRPVERYDCIVPVPAPFWREIGRGYNQAVLLAGELGRRWKIPVRAGWLRRTLFSPSQTKLTRKERHRNAQASFKLTFGRRRPLPERVLLVDDIRTTGSTLQACARLLKEGGAVTVSAATVAHEGVKSHL